MAIERSPVPYALFAATMALVWTSKRKRSSEKKEDGATTNLTSNTTTHDKKGHVSPRGAANLALPVSYLADLFICFGDLCDPTTNPQGHIPICVAENRLVVDLLQSRLNTPRAAQAGFGDNPEVYGYGDPQGLLVLRKALAQLLQERFSKQSKADNPIDSKHIAVGAGAVSILSNALFALGNPGDAVLIPAPYYAAFDNDLRAFAGCQTIPVACQDPAKGPSLYDLETAKLKAERERINVRFLLLTNPSNPLGAVYPPKVMKDAIAWARTHSMDTIVDEIYALSVFEGDFQSILELYKNDLGNDVHLVWGLSKDFGASGFRIGVLYTQNELLMEAMGNLIVFAWPSLPMQRIMADMLSDKAFVDSLLKESRRRLKHSYNLCTQVLNPLEVPYVPATSGMFLYLDLSEFIQTQQEEAIVGQILMKRARMVLTPGTTQHDPQPGRFRICFAYVSEEVLQIGMERLRKVVTKIRNQGGLGGWIKEDSHWQDILIPN